MILSPPLDIANLISFLKKDLFKIQLIDQRIYSILNDKKWESLGVNLSLFDNFKRCIKFTLNSDDLIKKTVDLIIKEDNLDKNKNLVFSVAVLEQFSLKYLIISLCLAKRIKEKNPSINIIFFGNCPLKHVEMIMENFKFIDAFTCDGFEYPVIKYLKSCGQKEISGMIVRTKNGKLLKPSMKYIPDLNKYPTPDFSLFNLKLYRKKNKLVIPYELSRGCINNCSFCYYIHKNNILSKNIKKAITDLKLLKRKYKTNLFHFMDAEINFNEIYLKSFCSELIKNNINIYWSALAIPNLNKDFFPLLKKSGCVQLRWGVESGSERILKIIKKKTTTKTIHESLKGANLNFINNYITILSNLPFESINDYSESWKFLNSVCYFTNSAKECVYGELGHFSIKKLEVLMDKTILNNTNNTNIKSNKSIYFSNKLNNDELKQKYQHKLSKLNINSDDIIDFMVNGQINTLAIINLCLSKKDKSNLDFKKNDLKEYNIHSNILFSKNVNYKKTSTLITKIISKIKHHKIFIIFSYANNTYDYKLLLLFIKSLNFLNKNSLFYIYNENKLPNFIKYNLLKEKNINLCNKKKELIDIIKMNTFG